MVEVERVRGSAGFARLHQLLGEYERDLPEDLRHGSEPMVDAAFLARIDGEDAGCVIVSSVATPSAILQRLYVRANYRGKGAARALAQAAIAYAREHGCARIVLDTDAQRLNAAFSLYRSLGFEECAPYGPVDYATPTFMQLRLR